MSMEEHYKCLECGDTTSADSNWTYAHGAPKCDNPKCPKRGQTMFCFHAS